MSENYSKEMASHIWNVLQVRTSNHKLWPVMRDGGVLFVGYADFILEVGGIGVIALPGSSIKLIGNKIHFDPKQEKSRDGTRFFPVWLPITAEARAVIDECLAADEIIVQMCHDAVAHITPAPESESGV